MLLPIAFRFIVAFKQAGADGVDAADGQDEHEKAQPNEQNKVQHVVDIALQ